MNKRHRPWQCLYFAGLFYCVEFKDYSVFQLILIWFSLVSCITTFYNFHFPGDWFNMFMQSFGMPVITDHHSTTGPEWTMCTYPGCRSWGHHSQRRSRCVVPALTWCWRCEHSWMPVDRCSRRAGRSAEARWRSPAMLPASALLSPASIGNTWWETRHIRLIMLALDWS